MATPVSVSTFDVRSHDAPDEVRTPDKTRVEVIRLDGFTFGRFIFDPGWRWSECVKPIVGGESCQVSHAGYVVSGQLQVRLNDGTQKTLRAGDSYTIPPGHDGWNDGSEPCISIEVMSAEQYARPQS